MIAFRLFQVKVFVRKVLEWMNSQNDIDMGDDSDGNGRY